VLRADAHHDADELARAESDSGDVAVEGEVAAEPA
jgi:hypothetical protein